MKSPNFAHERGSTNDSRLQTALQLSERSAYARYYYFRSPGMRALDSYHAECGGVFFPTPSSVFLPVGRAYITTNSAISGTCIFPIGPFRDFSKSTHVRTGGVRSTKLSGIVPLEDLYRRARQGAPPITGFAARGR